MPAPIVVISCSLSPASRSRVLARYAFERLHHAAHSPELIDLAEIDLPLCDGQDPVDHPGVELLRARIGAARGLLLSYPVYNYDAGAAAKNLIELTGPAWEGKVVAMACAAGSVASYMAPMGLAQSLMLDFHCHIVPRFVLVTGRSFSDDNLIDADARARMDRLVAELARVSDALGRPSAE